MQSNGIICCGDVVLGTVKMAPREEDSIFYRDFHLWRTICILFVTGTARVVNGTCLAVDVMGHPGRSLRYPESGYSNILHRFFSCFSQKKSKTLGGFLWNFSFQNLTNCLLKNYDFDHFSSVSFCNYYTNYKTTTFNRKNGISKTLIISSSEN